MSLWQQRMDDPVCLERRKKALICAVLSYLLYLLIIIISFQPTKSAVTIVLSGKERPSQVRWNGQFRRPGSGGARRSLLGSRRGRRGSSVQASVARKIEKPSSKKDKKDSNVSCKKVEKNSKKNRLNGGLLNVSQVEKRGAKKEQKKLEKRPEKNIEKKCERLELKQQKLNERPRVIEKAVVQPSVVEKVAEKLQDKVKGQRKEKVKKVAEKLEEKGEVAEKSGEQEVVHEEKSDLVEIGVSGEALSPDKAEGKDEDFGGEGAEVSRDEYALMCAISRVWRPPRCLKAGLSARLVVAVSGQGRAERVDIVTSSRVPAYDIAARASLYRASFPQVFWGKNIAVVFGQGNQ